MINTKVNCYRWAPGKMNWGNKWRWYNRFTLRCTERCRVTRSNKWIRCCRLWLWFKMWFLATQMSVFTIGGCINNVRQSLFLLICSSLVGSDTYASVRDINCSSSTPLWNNRFAVVTLSEWLVLYPLIPAALQIRLMEVYYVQWPLHCTTSFL